MTFEFINYLNPNDEVKIFWGIGPRVNINIDNFDTDKISVTDSIDYSYEKMRKNNYYEAGVTGAFGIEWFFRNNMSLHAEYSFNFSYFYRIYSRYRKGYNDYYDNDTFARYSYSDHGILFKANPLRFGLSVYF